MPHLSDQNGIKPAQNKMKSEYLFTHLVQFLVNALYRKPHHIVVTSLQSRASDIAYPFLDAIGSCLVERLVFRHVIFDFLFRERLEGYLCSHGELVLLLDGGQTDTRDDMVGLATQHAEHPLGIFRILGFSEDDAPTFFVVLFVLGRCDDHRVGSENQDAICQ